MFPSRSARTRIRLTGRRVIGAVISIAIIWITLDLLIFNFAGFGTLSEMKTRTYTNGAIKHLKNAFGQNVSERLIDANVIQRGNRSKLHDLIFGSYSKLFSSHEMNSTNDTTKRDNVIKSHQMLIIDSRAIVVKPNRTLLLDALHAKLPTKLNYEEKDNVRSGLNHSDKSLMARMKNGYLKFYSPIFQQVQQSQAISIHKTSVQAINGQTLSNNVTKLNLRPVAAHNIGNIARLTNTTVSSQTHTVPSQTHTVPSQAHTVPSQTLKVPSQTHTVSSQIHAIGSQTHIVSSQTHAIGSQTHTISSQTHAIGSQTHIVSSQTHAIGSQTHIVSSQTHAIGSQTHTVSSQTHAVASQTHAVSNQTHKVASQTHTVSSQTHKVASQTHTVSSQTHKVPSQPHTGSSQTHAVASQTHTVSSQTHAIGSQTHTGQSQTHAVSSPTHTIPRQIQMILGQTHTVQSQTHAVPSPTHTITRQIHMILSQTHMNTPAQHVVMNGHYNKRLKSNSYDTEIKNTTFAADKYNNNIINLTENIFSKNASNAKVIDTKFNLSSASTLDHVGSSEIVNNRHLPMTEKIVSDKKKDSHTKLPDRATLSVKTAPVHLIKSNIADNVSFTSSSLMPFSNVMSQVHNTELIVHQDGEPIRSASTNTSVKSRKTRDVKDSQNSVLKFSNVEEQVDLSPVFVKDMNIRRSAYNLSDFGENGRAVVVDKTEIGFVESGWNLSSFNQYVSDKISLERSIPDSRIHSCKQKTYVYSLLPRTSVIICFIDESWSTLVRTINSVLNRTPPELLAEILLVDDFSQRAHLQKPLEDYVGNYPKIKLIRLGSRHGLIRARLTAIEQAVGPVITLLDSHVECNKGWLEPLLDSIRRNRRAIVSPIIDVIDAQSFEYIAAPDTLRGSFDWGLNYQWHEIPAHEINRRKDRTTEIRTATIAGGLLSMDKQFFYELGAYDPDLEIWGAENIELSFKTWMCGGSLEIHPCSRVGHVFRDSQPYTLPGVKTAVEVFLKNSKRVAEVWMDDYKELFYRFIPWTRNLDVGSTSGRKEMKSRLGCRNFEWYLNEISPEIFRPSLFPEAWGLLINSANGKCLNTRARSIVPSVCQESSNALFFQLTPNKQIETFESCIGLMDGVILPVDCINEKKHVMKFNHRHSGDQIVDLKTDKCLTFRADNRAEKTVELELLPCISDRLDQKWSFEDYREGYVVTTEMVH